MSKSKKVEVLAVSPSENLYLIKETSDVSIFYLAYKDNLTKDAAILPEFKPDKDDILFVKDNIFDCDICKYFRNKYFHNKTIDKKYFACCGRSTFKFEASEMYNKESYNSSNLNNILDYINVQKKYSQRDDSVIPKMQAIVKYKSYVDDDLKITKELFGTICEESIKQESRRIDVINSCADGIIKNTKVIYDEVNTKKQELNNTIRNQLDTCTDIFTNRQGFYSKDENPFKNFEDASALLDLNREQVALVYSSKHISGLSTMLSSNPDFNDEQTYDKLCEYVTDIINYMLLIKGMVNDGLKDGGKK